MCDRFIFWTKKAFMWNTKECLTIYTNSCAEFFGICVALFETTCNEDIASGMEKSERAT